MDGGRGSEEYGDWYQWFATRGFIYYIHMNVWLLYLSHKLDHPTQVYDAIPIEIFVELKFTLYYT